MARSGPARCSCGRPKYPDAMSCDKCWDAQKGWDDSAPGNSPSPSQDKLKCSCGNPKYADAMSCDECWERAGHWPDR